MKKLALLAGVAVITAGSVGTADAQHRYYHRHGGWNNGGAVAAGLIGGAVIGGLLTAAATPSYAYPGYGYGYYPYGAPAYGYRYSYGYGYPAAYPAYSYPAYGYYSAPATRVVYRPAPVYQTRVVYRQPRVATRVVYREPRYRTRVVYRDRDRPRVVRAYRRDVVSTGSVWRQRQADRVRRLEDTRSSR
ncbi:hypothetical protein FHR70_002878 [Microvirga lupini]|uniref:Uncharacterized protein n=1 Tax=Microvirga lupini TaxID=420324 RepID=A0A7W4VME6_9HYPH|nr:hypothetical protein [Microvirga lupini]MBB3019813.1 hypothetical protein [Microvirga lupini]